MWNGAPTEKVRAGEDELRQRVREPGFSVNGFFALRHRFVPVGGYAEIVFQVAETLRMGDELPQHRKQRPGVQGGQPRPERRGAGLVVQLREVFERVPIDPDDPVGMFGRAPVSGFVLDAGHGTVAVVVEAGIDGRRCEEVRDVCERGIGRSPP